MAHSLGAGVATAAPGPSAVHEGASPAHSALGALCIVARLHQVAAEPASLAHQLAWRSDHVPDAKDLALAARYLGLNARLARPAADRLAMTPLPALAMMRTPSGGITAVVLAQCDGERVLVAVKEVAAPQVMPIEDFLARWTGELILIASRASMAGELARFDFSWFIPSIVRHRKLLGEVLLVSLFLQVLALVTPLFFQVVMDKVLVHKGYTTLDVLAAGLLAAMLFESALSVLRGYIFSHTTSRIDVELGSKLFRHLMQLPLAYFQARRVGDSVARVRELENIRSFLTGSALTLLLDAVFSVVFIALMFSYSATLTLVVLASLPAYLLLGIGVVPVLRARLNEKFARGAENQALLVEAISGIETVKAAALEPQLTRRWDQQLAAYVSASFRTQTLAQVAHEVTNLVGKFVSLGTLWFGARLAMAGELSIGELVAFNMFAGRVAQPIMRMAQMWTDFQQTGLSVARLGDVLNTRTELLPRSASPIPALQGRVGFDGVVFRYRPGVPPVLNGVSLDVRPGEVIGIVGRSGSGKSTLTKLIQRLHLPEEGRVLIDGHDIASLDPVQLRRQVGVVLQENLLFNRTVRENIAITDPAAPMEAVIHVARLAGAHDFITELPEGYDTVISEHGSSLSGGQRQRIAIARALFANPRILIFDEATSALDYESEAVIQRNMAAICRGRTVFVIAHRLSAVRQAHRIVAMDKGRIVEIGTHDQLLARPKGLYAHLWRMQSGAGTNVDKTGAPQ